MKLDTICVQGAYEPKNGEPRVVPIIQSTTFKYNTSEDLIISENLLEGDRIDEAKMLLITRI